MGVRLWSKNAKNHLNRSVIRRALLLNSLQVRMLDTIQTIAEHCDESYAMASVDSSMSLEIT